MGSIRYEQSADHFVAAFVGHVNLLRAQAVEGGLRLGPLRLPLPPNTPPLIPGQEVILALHPDAIRIGKGSAEAEVRGEVASRTYLGATVRYRIEVAGQYLTVDDPDPAGRPILTGTLALSFDPSRLRVWAATPAESGLLQPGP